jgi:hypothetical protein
VKRRDPGFYPGAVITGRRDRRLVVVAVVSAFVTTTERLHSEFRMLNYP